MKTWFIYCLGAFEEDTVGKLSITRIMFAVVVLVACVLAVYFAFRGGVSLTEISLVTGMMGCAFGAKVWQKKYEGKSDISTL